MKINASDLASVKTSNQPAFNGRQSVTVTDIHLSFGNVMGLTGKFISALLIWLIPLWLILFLASVGDYAHEIKKVSGH